MAFNRNAVPRSGEIFREANNKGPAPRIRAFLMQEENLTLTVRMAPLAAGNPVRRARRRDPPCLERPTPIAKSVHDQYASCTVTFSSFNHTKTDKFITILTNRNVWPRAMNRVPGQRKKVPVDDQGWWMS